MKKIIYLLAFVFAFGSCADDLTDLNVDTKNPQLVPATNLVANATVELFDFMTSTNVNVNNFRLWSQHWAQTTYPDESNYELVERDVNGEAYETFYTEILRDLKEAKAIINSDPVIVAGIKANQLAVIDVLEAVCYTHLVDIFGDVPYSAAFGDDVTPAYDDDAAIYDAMISKLQAAIPNLKGDNGMGNADLIYGGDGDAWRKFANSYLLRLAIRIADTNNAKAKSLAEAAVASGVFESNADNFQISYEGSPPNTNPVWEDLVQSGRSDFVAANTMVDYMNDLEDPRRDYYFKNKIDVEVSPGVFESVWQGGIYGASNSFAGNSQPGTILENPTLPGVIMGYTEVLFLLADAVERGYAVGGTAAGHYHAAITNSIVEWGGSQAAADSYIAKANVAYSSAPGDWREKIAMQKWIALYNQGFEAWTTYRLYDAPQMNIAEGAGTTPPSRYTYPVNELSLNGENVTQAGNNMGGDKLMSKIFWDAN